MNTVIAYISYDLLDLKDFFNSVFEMENEILDYENTWEWINGYSNIIGEEINIRREHNGSKSNHGNPISISIISTTLSSDGLNEKLKNVAKAISRCLVDGVLVGELIRLAENSYKVENGILYTNSSKISECINEYSRIFDLEEIAPYSYASDRLELIMDTSDYLEVYSRNNGNRLSEGRIKSIFDIYVIAKLAIKQEELETTIGKEFDLLSKGITPFERYKFKESYYNQINRCRIATHLFNVNQLTVSNHELTRLMFIEEMKLRKFISRSSNFENYDVDVFYFCAYLLSRYSKICDLQLFIEAKQIDFDTSIGFDEQFMWCFDRYELLQYSGEFFSETQMSYLHKLQSFFRRTSSGKIKEEIEYWGNNKKAYFRCFRYPIKSEFALKNLGII